MLKWEQMMEVQILRRQGKSLRQIAQEMGISVNTVVKYLKYQGKPVYRKRRKLKLRKLAPYEDYLSQRIQLARPLWIPATVLLREILAQGYDGGLSQLRAYLRDLKFRRRTEV